MLAYIHFTILLNTRVKILCRRTCVLMLFVLPNYARSNGIIFERTVGNFKSAAAIGEILKQFLFALKFFLTYSLRLLVSLKRTTSSWFSLGPVSMEPLETSRFCGHLTITMHGRLGEAPL